ncbi:hypothetical protein GUITHDRAFT_153919 [Guillardia theta CCMP2712]|uniref:Uncharacterized protein n=1 Tax=Guillardia theta (strain CCMP2712) TaxID=905079 RepID=L1IXX5_GUITC|nr:hypothetical protein GUITHDRAFT_153919 [Guillardia theta CCMP2712]EKX41091.1 hypothetical protein GUITHDRAFT_153919 [Guillardia theta CCMP2712]|eukprot:XP_005828071.1 hypothetical protein GUITHDRAFT_153919 [Guillardia theta CCMP2712]
MIKELRLRQRLKPNERDGRLKKNGRQKRRLNANNIFFGSKIPFNRSKKGRKSITNFLHQIIFIASS